MPAVSVIIPIFNMERFLPECLDSVLKQSLRDIELICVNDGSTDGSREILERYAALDPRIVLLHQENQGVYAARNHALRLAAGEYAAFMDPDDSYPDASALETLHRAATANGAAICGGSLLEFIDGRTRPVPDRTFHEEGWVDYRDDQREYGFQCYLFSRRLLRENALEFPPYTPVSGSALHGRRHAQGRAFLCRFRKRYTGIVWAINRRSGRSGKSATWFAACATTCGSPGRMTSAIARSHPQALREDFFPHIMKFAAIRNCWNSFWKRKLCWIIRTVRRFWNR